MSFVFKARRRAHSKAYVTVAATPKTDDRASKIGKLYLDDSLVRDSGMGLVDILIRTETARSGTRVGEVLRQCVAHNVPGIPYRDAQGRIIGRASIRHILKQTCIPRDMVKGAHMLLDAIEHVQFGDAHVRELLEMPVDPFVLKNKANLGLDSPLVKALSVMEHMNTGYVFVLREQEYLGVVTRMGIARLLIELGGG